MNAAAGEAGLLVVDDDPGFTRTLEILLEEERPYPVRVANSGFEALRILQDSSVRLVVCDLAMPGMDGLELVRRLRRSASEVAVIIIATHQTEESQRQAAELGVRHCMQKPIEPEEFLTRVDQELVPCCRSP